MAGASRNDTPVTAPESPMESISCTWKRFGKPDLSYPWPWSLGWRLCYREYFTRATDVEARPLPAPTAFVAPLTQFLTQFPYVTLIPGNFIIIPYNLQLHHLFFPHIHSHHITPHPGPGHSPRLPLAAACMSDFEGPQATRLFVDHARENGCNNVELIQLLENGSRRDPLAELTGDIKKDLLPTKDRIDRVFCLSDTLLSLLCCRCRLCDRNDGFKNLVRNAKILDESEKRKELAILILSGCLFALRDLCTQANFQVARFAARIPTSPPQSHLNDSSCLSRIAPVPIECSHEFFDKKDQLLSMQDICVDCRKRAFQIATTENSIVVDIPKLERTSLILDYSDQNIPFIQECPQEKLNERLTPRFLTSQIEPSCCDEELKVSIQRKL